MVMGVEQSVERLARETEVLGVNLSQFHFIHNKSHITSPELEPGPATNRMSYGAVLQINLLLMSYTVSHKEVRTSPLGNQ
jgi:hypothetical protein